MIYPEIGTKYFGKPEISMYEWFIVTAREGDQIALHRKVWEDEPGLVVAHIESLFGHQWGKYYSTEDPSTLPRVGEFWYFTDDRLPGYTYEVNGRLDNPNPDANGDRTEWLFIRHDNKGYTTYISMSQHYVLGEMSRVTD